MQVLLGMYRLSPLVWDFTPYIGYKSVQTLKSFWPRHEMIHIELVTIPHNVDNPSTPFICIQESRTIYVRLMPIQFCLPFSVLGASYIKILTLCSHISVWPFCWCSPRTYNEPIWNKMKSVQESLDYRPRNPLQNKNNCIPAPTGGRVRKARQWLGCCWGKASSVWNAKGQ